MRRCSIAKTLFVGLSLCGWCASQACGQAPDSEYAPRIVLQRPLPAITDAPVVPVDEAEVDLNELVIGVEIEGKSRAYPINQLTGPKREIINDELAGVAIAATW